MDNILIELNASDNPVNYYIYTPSGMLLTRMKPNGDLQYYHGDIRGSVILLTDEETNITHQYRYDDFGTITNYSEPEDDYNFFRYVGIYGVEHELEDLYYMRARYYKPSIGRFLSEDPIWSTNLYPYADNNPISKVDPLGKDGVSIFIESDGIGHVYIDVNETIFSYGRYAGTKTPQLRSFAPIGEGVLLKFEGAERNQFILGRSDYPTYMYNVDDASESATYNYLNTMYNSGINNKGENGLSLIHI